MSRPSFDFAIIGAGAAGLHLAIQLATDPFFHDKKILILDKDDKKANDRTWSFWEEGASHWDALTIKQWEKAIFYSHEGRFDIPLQNYRYKTIRSADFYSYARELIKKSNRFEWIKDEIADLKGQTIVGKQDSYEATHLFDSRIPSAFSASKGQYASLIQHFVGWFIETPEPVFDDQEFTIMDYRIKWKDQTSFNYVLPFSPTTALVEFTLFNEYLLEQKDYEQTLNQYIHDLLGIKDFRITEKEIGQIPMSTYPFHQHHEPHLTKIGTAGGWVRPSSGYSFRNGQRYASQIVENLKKGALPHKRVATNRFRFYDRIFIGVLQERNDLGEEIFQTLYTKQPPQSLFRFLDEQSNLLEDVRIMLSLNQPIFRKTLVNSLRNR